MCSRIGIFKLAPRSIPQNLGDAIVWKDGYVRDEPVRKALEFLFKEGYLIEYDAAFEWTKYGAEHLSKAQSKHGARVYKWATPSWSSRQYCAGHRPSMSLTVKRNGTPRRKTMQPLRPRCEKRSMEHSD